LSALDEETYKSRTHGIEASRAEREAREVFEKKFKANYELLFS